MVWQLRADGHALSEAEEKKLFRMLGALLSTATYGTSQPVYFEGDFVTGNPLSEDDLGTARVLSVEAYEPQLRSGTHPALEGVETDTGSTEETESESEEGGDPEETESESEEDEGSSEEDDKEGKSDDSVG